jgi:hypothetical protein
MQKVFYRNFDRDAMVVDIKTEPKFEVGTPQSLFEAGDYLAGEPTRGYNISRDDQRFLMVKGQLLLPPVTRMSLVQNWFEELKRLVPTGN